MIVSTSEGFKSIALSFDFRTARQNRQRTEPQPDAELRIEAAKSSTLTLRRLQKIGGATRTAQQEDRQVFLRESRRLLARTRFP